MSHPPFPHKRKWDSRVDPCLIMKRQVHMHNSVKGVAVFAFCFMCHMTNACGSFKHFKFISSNTTTPELEDSTPLNIDHRDVND